MKDKKERFVVESESDTRQLIELKKRLSELERIIGQKQIQIEFQNKMMDLAEETYGVKLIAVKGCIVTIDATGCQKKIAEKIVEKNADYLPAVKDNQEKLHEQVKKVFRLQNPVSFHSQEEFGHGRIETRECEVITDLGIVTK